MITTLTSLAFQMGAPRILQAAAINHPVGQLGRPIDEERRWRRRLLERALDAVQASIEQQQIFTLI